MDKIAYGLDVLDTPSIVPAELKDLVNLASPGPNYILKKAPIHSDLNVDAWRKYSHIFSQDDPTLLDQLIWGFLTGVQNPENLSVVVVSD